MPLKVLSSALRGMYLGSTAIARAYLGSTLVFEADDYGPPDYTPLAWDPSTVAEITSTAILYDGLYNNDRTLFCERSASGVRALVGKSDGKQYFEVYLHRVNQGFSSGIGVCDAVFNVGGAVSVGADTRNIVVRFNTTDTNILFNNAKQAELPGSPRTGTFGVAVDLDARLFWVRHRDGLWNGDEDANPATGVGGVSMTGNIGAGIEIFPMFKHGRSIGATGYATIFGATEEMAFGPPAGFSAWGGSSGQTISSILRIKEIYQSSWAGDPLKAKHIAAYEALLDSLPSTVMGKLDGLYIPATTNPELARLNLKDLSWTPNATAPAMPPFLPDRGFAYPGASNTDPVRLTLGQEQAQTNFKQNDGHVGVWSLFDKGNDSMPSFFGGSPNSHVANAQGGGFQCRAQATLSNTFSDVVCEGHLMWNRNNADNFQVFRNGVQVKSETRASAALGSSIMGIGPTGALSGNAAPNPYCAFHYGAALTSSEISDLYDALDAYMEIVLAPCDEPSPQFTIYRPRGSANSFSIAAFLIWRLADGDPANFNPSANSIANPLREITIPEDVKRYRVRVRLAFPSASLSPQAWCNIQRNGILVHQTSDVHKNATVGGFTDHTVHATSAVLTRSIGGETIRVQAFTSSGIQIDADFSYLQIEVLERHA